MAAKLSHLVIIIAFAFLHFIVSMAFLLMAIGSSMRGIDTGAPLTTGEHIIDFLNSILHIPFVTFVLPQLSSTTAGSLGYLPFLVDSLLWGIALYFLLTFFQKKQA